MDKSTSRQGDDSGGETKKERINRELIELLNEIRVGLPGVQFLFAFVLIVPFQQGASKITGFERGLYVVTMVASALSLTLLIAPAAQHRVLFRQHDKEALLRRSSRSAFGGLMVLIVAISSALLLVLDAFLGRWQAWLIAGLIAALLVWWWAVVPLWHRAHNEQDEPGA
ncbi:MAG: DUF6328 family protein [Blastococcus sp.]